MFENAFAGCGAMGDLDENSVIILAQDPHERLVSIDFFDHNGQPVQTRTWVRNGDRYVYNFPQKLPSDTEIRVLLATPGATVAFPFELKDIPLP